MKVHFDPIRVLLVDDNELVLWGMGKVIDAERPRMRVIGKARCCHEALVAVRTERPDVVLLDVNLANENGLDCLPLLIDGTGAQVIVLSSTTDPLVHARALRLGAHAVIRKEMPARVVLDAIVRATPQPGSCEHVVSTPRTQAICGGASAQAGATAQTKEPVQSGGHSSSTEGATS